MKKEKIDTTTSEPKNEALEKEKQLKVCFKLEIIFLNSCFVFFSKLQNDLFWKYRDEIDKELSNDGIKALFEHNNQTFSKAGRDDVIFFSVF